MTEKISIQSRDIELLALLFESRLITLRHAAALVFSGSMESAKKRIQKLKAAGLISEKRRKAYEPGILFLSPKGFLSLRDSGILPEEDWSMPAFARRASISELTLRHELEVMDVKAAFYLATKKCPNVEITDFSTRPQSSEFSVDDRASLAGRKTVKPDGFIRLREAGSDGSAWEHLFFLEVDRSTERLETLTERCRLYNQFYRSGGMAKRFGKPPESYSEYPFRVLLVCKSPERRDNLARALLSLRPPILTQVCLSTLEEIRSEPFSSIWRVPADYQEAGDIPFRSLLG